MDRLISTSLPRRGITSTALAADVVALATLYGLAGLLPNVLHHASDSSMAHAFTVLSSGIAMAAAILLALAAWLSTNGRAIRIAFAVMVYEAFLLLNAIDPNPITNGLLVGDLALIGASVLCGLALRRDCRENGVEGAWRTSALISAAAVIGCAIVSRVPGLAPAAWLQRALDVGTWAVAAAAGLALVYCGIRSSTPVLRRVGLALLTLTAAPVLRAAHALPGDQPSLTASALGLAGVAMLLAAAAPFAVGALRTVWRELADSQARLDAAEKAMANSAVRDHEMRNLVAGLSGAESVLAAQEADEDSPESRRQLRAAARAELERLRRILDNGSAELGRSGPSAVAVAPLLSDLATLHGATGPAIELNVANDLQALVPPECLAHIVTNLLVNCARHAPGARVWLTASRRADRVVIEVTDDGPGLPPDLTAELLEPGMRGPSSTGTGDRATVLIVDDHELLSHALVIALGSRGLRAQHLAPHELLARLDQPAPPGGLVLLDLDLGDDIDGAKLVRPLRRAGWRVLVITGTRDQPPIAAAVAAGAVGWLPKTAPFDDLVAQAVRAAQGRSLVTDTARLRMVDVANAAREATEELDRRWQQLTPREHEIVNCLVDGLRAGAIAGKYTVSVATVRTQIRSILAKLEVSSQLEAVALARQR